MEIVRWRTYCLPFANQTRCWSLCGDFSNYVYNVLFASEVSVSLSLSKLSIGGFITKATVGHCLTIDLTMWVAPFLKKTFFCTSVFSFFCLLVRGPFATTNNSCDRLLTMGPRMRNESLPCQRKLNNCSSSEKALTIESIVKDSSMDAFGHSAFETCTHTWWDSPETTKDHSDSTSISSTIVAFDLDKSISSSWMSIGWISTMDSNS